MRNAKSLRVVIKNGFIRVQPGVILVRHAPGR